MARITTKATSRGGRSASAGAGSISPEVRQHMIGEAAYYRYVHRGFTPGHELDDWLEAEADFERTTVMPPPRESAAIAEFEVQQSGARGAAADEALKRMIKRHPRRDIPMIESVDPEDAPLKE